jgi:hypothetical protein
MRNLIILLLVFGILVVAGCSNPQEVTAPEGRTAQVVQPGMSPALAYQLNTGFAWGFPGIMAPIEAPLGALGFSSEDIIEILETGTLVNACMPTDIDVPEWDEWLLATTVDIDVPEWDEWLLLEEPEWEEWLLDIDVPEWDEWLYRFECMPKYRSTDWMDWAVYGPIQIVDIDVPEWDEWLYSLTISQIAASYDAWLAGEAIVVLNQ